MDSPERSRRRDAEDGSDLKSDRAGDDEELEGSERRKHRSSRSRKSGNGEEAGGVDSSGRRRSHGDKSESRKRLGGSSNADSDEEDCDLRKEWRSKLIKKKQEESSLEKLSSWYQDGDLENRQDGGDKSGSRGLVRAEESEGRKLASKLAQHENSQTLDKKKSKEEKSHDGEHEKTLDRDSKYPDRKESMRDKTHGSSEQVRTSRRKWDESDGGKKVEESYHERSDSKSGKSSDPKYETNKEKTGSARNEPGDSKIRGLDLSSERGTKLNNKEERKADAEKSKSKSRGEILEEENRGSPISREDRSGKGKSEKHRQQRTSTARDASEGRERLSNVDDDPSAGMKDKGAREFETTTRSRTPERTGKRYQESEQFDSDYDRSFNLKRKELDKDGYRDDRPKGRDDNYSDRNRDREVPKENWKRRQTPSNDKDSKNGDIAYDHGREWELPRHGRERSDNERPHGWLGNRKDGSRGEAVKTSSNFGISNENYDVIEIQTKPIDYGRAELGSNFSWINEVCQQSDGKLAPNDEEWARKSDMYGPGPPREDSRERYTDEATWKDDFDGVKGRGQRGSMPGRSAGGHSSGGGSQPPYGNAEPGPFSRNASQGVKGGRGGRGGRGRLTGRDNQQIAITIPMIGSPFGPIGMPPPGPMQPLTPNMSPAPGPPMFPFSPPVWPGARGVDISMLTMPPAVPHGSVGPRFPPNMVTPTNPSMFFSQPGPGRGGPPSISAPSFTPAGPMGRGTPADKNQGGWVPHKTTGPPGKAPSRGEQNDYSQNFVDTGMRPQNFIRELELTNVVEDYPKLRELIQKKDEIVAKAASHPMYHKCDLKEFELSPEFFGTKFDVILVDPPWEEYVHRAPGVADHTEYWTFEEIMNLKIEAIADTPSFIFLWVGDGMGLEQGRQCLKKWGFRRCEDICWVKTNKTNATPGLRHDSHTLFQHSKEHCLMGIKGTVRRSTDGHIIHANIDTDVIIAEEPPYGSTQKPDDMYRIIEHFALGCRRLELFGEDHNIRAGWLTVGKGLSSSNFNAEAYIRNFADKDGKVWQGGGGRNPPPEAPHLVVTTPDIEALRPKSPMKNQQQMQHQQSASISLTAGNSSNRRPAGNSPQNPSALINQEATSSNPSTPAPWASSPMEGFKGRDGSIMPSDDKVFDMYGYSGQANGDYVDFEQRHMNLL